MKEGFEMAYLVDSKEVSTQGLETSPHKEALAGLCANEARYFMNKYNHEFTTINASEGKDILDYIENILRTERDLVFESKPLEVSQFVVECIKMSYVFYESGLSINVMYSDAKKALGFKLSDGMEIPLELVDKFKFARQKSKLAGTIRGSYFVIKGEY